MDRLGTHPQVVQNLQTLLDHFGLKKQTKSIEAPNTYVLHSELHSHQFSGVANILLYVIEFNFAEISVKLGSKSREFLCITIFLIPSCGIRG